MERGTFGFEMTSAGDLADRAKNVELLRKLWLDRSVISDNELGEGDPGDFDHGAWHIACHLVAAAGVCRDRDGRLLWAEISHRRGSDDYCAVGSENFFDGFGFAPYRERFHWNESTIYDYRESKQPPTRPLLPYIERIAHGTLPEKWDRRTHEFVQNDDWLLMDHALARRVRCLPPMNS